MLPPVFLLLAGAAPVTALIGNPPRVYRHGSAPQAAQMPYVTWSVPGGAPSNTFDGADGDFWRVQVDCWVDGDGDGDDAVETLAAAVRAALEPAAHLVAYLADERDADSGCFRMSFAFDFITSR